MSPSRLELSAAAYSVETHVIRVQQVCCQTVKHTSHVQSAWYGTRIVDKHVVSGQAIVDKSSQFAVVRRAKLHKCEVPMAMVRAISSRAREACKVHLTATFNFLGAGPQRDVLRSLN